MSTKDMLDMIDTVTGPNTMTKAEALEFLEVLELGIETRMECLKEEMANEGDLAKLPKLRSNSRPKASETKRLRKETQVTTRFKTPRAKK